MLGTRAVWRARLVAALVLVSLMAGAMAPAGVGAETDLDVGGVAVIAYAGGERVRLRSGAGTGTTTIALLDEGTQVRVQRGPVQDPEGGSWFEVIAGDDTGYVSADFLADSGQLYTGGVGPAIANTAVHLRSGPSTADRILATLGYGDAVEVTGANRNGWFPVTSGDLSGFVYRAFLTPGTGGAGAFTTPGVRYVLERVRLRTGPGTGYRTITVLAVGTRLDFTGEVQGQYARVTASAGSGWVAAQYIGPRNPLGGETRYTTSTVHLRSGPGTSYRSITYLPSGARLDLTGDRENGFVKASTRWGTGWVYAQYVGSAPSSSSSTTTAYTNDRVNFRSGPGSSNGVIQTLATGTRVGLTGTTRNGYSEARVGSRTGWIATSYLSNVAPQYEGGTRYTIDSVNLRRGASVGSGVIAVVPSRTEIRFTGTVVNNFGKVATRFGDGWISIDYFRKSRPAPPSGSLVVWPVKGGEWRVSQGYNGSSHQNRTSAWQYYYSFDLKRNSGQTAWQPVYAPVDGRIRWIDESTGGMSIYMGDGLAFAMFHVLWDSSVREGQTIRQGQYLGVIAPDGRAGNGGTAHLHITAWTTSDEGNWSRRAQPFTGRFAIEGVSFPSRNRWNDYLNYAFNP